MSLFRIHPLRRHRHRPVTRLHRWLVGAIILGPIAVMLLTWMLQSRR